MNQMLSIIVVIITPIPGLSQEEKDI